MIRLMLGFVAALTMTGGAFAQSAVERGGYLMNTIMTCANCHSPKGPPAATAGKDYSGGLRFNEPPFDVTAPNITQDKETGIGNWSDDDIKRALTHGARPANARLPGVPLAVMAVNFFKALLPEDQSAIVAYLRSVKPVRNAVPEPVYRVPVRHQQ